jgi:DNA-binding IclR family transcriptional regulator
LQCILRIVKALASADPHDPVTAVLRAVGLLDAFRTGDDRLSLAELARRAALPKTTAFRLAHTLGAAGYLVQRDDGTWRLGPATARLGARYQTAFDVENVIEPVLVALARRTRETTSFWAHDGSQRVRIARVHGAHPLALTTPVGEALPLDRGAAGRVILAAIGRRGAVYDAIRDRGYHATVGEAQREFASIAAAVFGRRRAVVGSVAIAVSVERVKHDPAMLTRHATEIVKAARRLSALLATVHDTTDVASTWPA